MDTGSAAWGETVPSRQMYIHNQKSMERRSNVVAASCRCGYTDTGNIRDGITQISSLATCESHFVSSNNAHTSKDSEMPGEACAQIKEELVACVIRSDWYVGISRDVVSRSNGDKADWLACSSLIAVSGTVSRTDKICHYDVNTSSPLLQIASGVW